MHVCAKACAIVCTASALIVPNRDCWADEKKITHGYVETSRGVIFSESVANAKKVCAKLQECWNPKVDEIEVLEADLYNFLAISKDWGSAEILKNLPSYKRKYYGFIKNSIHYVFVVGVCPRYWGTERDDFASPFLPMKDIGTCYFSVEYDVKRRTFSEYYVDGEG